MTPLEKSIISLRRRKQIATNLRKKSENQLKTVQSLEKRSSSGLHSIDRKIESEKDEVDDVSVILNQKTSQLDSIGRLITAAHDNLNREKIALSISQEELEFAQNPDEKHTAQFNLNAISEHIKELEFEIKSREKTGKTIATDVGKYQEIKSHIDTKIKKQSKSKPILRETITGNHKDVQKSIKDLEQKIKTEQLAVITLQKATLNLKAINLKKGKSTRSKSPSRKATKTRSKSPSRKATKTRSKSSKKSRT